MPRTKVVKKRRTTQEKGGMCNETFDISQSKKKDVGEKIGELKEDIRESIHVLEIEKDKNIMKISEKFGELRLKVIEAGFGNITLKDLRCMKLEDEVNEVGNHFKFSSAVKETNSFAKPKCQRNLRKRSNSCSSRSSKATYNSLRSASCERPSRTIHTSASKVRTPMNRNIPSMPVVTPKINPNQPLSVLRRPRQGEYALSMCGSPLMVSGVTCDDMVSVTIPLADGRVLSILPTEGIDSTNVTLDEVTRMQLLKLRSNLTKCLKK